MVLSFSFESFSLHWSLKEICMQKLGEVFTVLKSPGLKYRAVAQQVISSNCLPEESKLCMEYNSNHLLQLVLIKVNCTSYICISFLLGPGIV